MTSSRPYLIRAIHEWVVDNGLTPHVLVNARITGVQVPREYVQNGQVILNISPHAAHGLQLGNEWIEFKARFGGVPHQIAIPTSAVLAVYARENGVGMAFQEEGPEGEPPPTPSEDKPKGPTLRVVK